MKLKYLAFLLSVFFFSNLYSQLSKKHYIPPLTSSDGFTSQYIYISTPKNNTVSFKITQIGQPNGTITGTVSNSQPYRFDISGNQDSQLHANPFDIGSVISDKGFVIEAQDVVFVSVRVRSAFANGNNRFHGGALVSKGAAALGNEFRIGGFERESAGTQDLTFASFMATEDDTSVRYTSDTGTQTIILNELESYVITSGGTSASDILGNLISSDKPIVVNSGSATGSFGDTVNNSDYGFDQIVDASKIGTDYIMVKGAGNNFIENVLVIAHEDDTEIFLNGQSIGSVDAGDYFTIEGNNYVNGNMSVNSSKPIFVYQGIGSPRNGNTESQANQGLFFVPPLSCENKGDVNNIADIDRIGPENFPGGVTIVTNKDANVFINENEISTINNVEGPLNVVGNDGYVTYRVTGLTGNIKVESDKELYCAYYNANDAATTGGFYSGFPSAPEFNFETTVASLGSCIPNVTLQAANPDLFDEFEWQYFDESTQDWEFRSDKVNYKPLESEPGRYKLIGTLDCTGTKFESVEIPVSICPDDFDGDLIIDNLDVDLDNDGILNCDESLGNATIDLSDSGNPAIIFSDNSSNNSIISSALTATEVASSFIGQDNGDFTATIQPNAADSDLKYELNFTENVSFKFVEAAPATETENVSYILKVSPNSKNVTLEDLDDRLLIDTNFDGEFETGITNISASEIRFKINPNPTGTTPYQFLANQINQISLELKSNSLANPATFSGNIQLTCFALDSDGDGIEDALDLDSDNDGIPDLYEASAPKTTLLGIDTNLDGLDDAFEGVTTNIDSDNDGVPNYLDVDSDNDGIYDAVEAGHGQVDANNDGVLDNAIAANVGSNGLLNALETAADAKVLALNYNIADTDADDIFNFLELDADNDECFDVIEAGFTGDAAGILFANPFGVDANGKVQNSVDGYTAPNADYITSAPILLNTPFEDPFICENSTDIISIDSTADTFQWEISTDNGVNWSALINDAIYAGVTTKDLQITNTLQSYQDHQFRVVMNRAGNACATTSNPVVLNIYPLPVIKNNPAEIDQCISANNNNPTVNLTVAEINISETPNVTFEYYEDNAGVNRITNETSYPVQVNASQSVFVKVISEQGCSESFVELIINVGQTPDNPYNEIQPAVCDDFLDADGNDTPGANDDTDFITNFFLDKNAIVNSINPPVNTEVFFYENSQDRTNSVNEIDIANYRNDINKIDSTPIPEGIQFPVYYKILSTVNNNCQGIGEFYLQINSVPAISSENLSPITECDSGDIDGNYSNGSNANIDLTQKIDELFQGTSQDRNNFSFSFYKTADAADLGDTNSSEYISNPSQFTNDVPATFTPGDLVTQPIYVRIENNATGCVNPHASFEVIINPAPTVTAIIEPIEVCDVGTKDGDVRNGLAQNIDISTTDTFVLDSKDPASFTVTYHKTQSDLQDLNSSGINKSSYDSDPARVVINPTTNISEEILFIRIINNTTGCLFDQSTVTIVVNPEPDFIPPTNLASCDNSDDGDDTNGIIQNIDLDGKIPEILGANQSPNDFIVTFHSSRDQATSGDDPIASPYENTNPTETIYVRIQNKKTGCINDDAFFDIIVNPLPDFTVTTPQILCLNDLPLNIFVENATEIYSYEWTNESGAPLGTQDNLNINSGGTYFVKATTTNGTSCARTEQIVINESNIATLEESFVTIIDESNNLGSNNNLSISIDTISNDLGPGDYQFAILNTDNNQRTPFAGFQDEPLFENLEGGIYQIIVNDKNGCVPDATLLVSVIQFPKFFTPNGDNENDTWLVKGANQTFYPNASINIFNRFGKLVAQVPIDSNGWDGSYGGNTLPSDDYWFNVTLIPANNNKPTIKKTGHFSLLRR